MTHFSPPPSFCSQPGGGGWDSRQPGPGSPWHRGWEWGWVGRSVPGRRGHVSCSLSREGSSWSRLGSWPPSDQPHLEGKGRATEVYNDIRAPGRIQQHIATLRFSSPFISTVPTTKGHLTIWVLPRTDEIPRTWIFSFKSKTRQGKPERAAYPIPVSPARVCPSLGSVLTPSSKPAVSLLKCRQHRVLSCFKLFRISPRCVTRPPRPHTPHPCLTSSTSLSSPAPCALPKGSWLAQPGLDQQSLWNPTVPTVPYPILVNAPLPFKRLFFQEAFSEARSWLLFSWNPGLPHR